MKVFMETRPISHIRHCGHALVDLLVVIPILALLSLLMPTRFRESADKAVSVRSIADRAHASIPKQVPADDAPLMGITGHHPVICRHI
jgi:hypothetical protein